jgi:hypothetical protein
MGVKELVMAVLIVLMVSCGAFATGVAVSYGNFEVNGANVSLSSLEVKGTLTINEGQMNVDENLSAPEVDVFANGGSARGHLDAKNIVSDTLHVDRGIVKANNITSGTIYNEGDGKITAANTIVNSMKVDTGSVFYGGKVQTNQATVESGAVMNVDSFSSKDLSMCCGAIIRNKADANVGNMTACCGAGVYGMNVTANNVDLSAGAFISTTNEIQANRINNIDGGKLVAKRIDTDNGITTHEISIQNGKIVAV